MTGLRSLIRRFGSAIGLASTLLLACTAWVVGVHHHDPATAHGCAVCTTAHAPAVIGIAVSTVTAPRPVIATILEPTVAAPTILATGIAPSRAPPRV